MWYVLYRGSPADGDYALFFAGWKKHLPILSEKPTESIGFTHEEMAKGVAKALSDMRRVHDPDAEDIFEAVSFSF